MFILFLSPTILYSQNNYWNRVDSTGNGILIRNQNNGFVGINLTPAIPFDIGHPDSMETPILRFSMRRTGSMTNKALGGIEAYYKTGNIVPAKIDFMPETGFSSSNFPTSIQFTTTSTNAGSRAVRMTINSVGNVGVGTTSPRGIFHSVSPDLANIPLFERSGQTADNMWGAARFLSTKTTAMNDGFGTSVSLNIQDDEGVVNQIASFGALRNGSDNSGDFVIATANNGSNTEKFRITKTGNIGIGNNVAVSATRVVLKGISNGSASAGLDIQDYAGNSHFFVRDDGKIGISTNNPSEKLEIVGNQLITGNLTVTGQLNLSGTGSRIIGNQVVEGNLKIGTATDSRIYFANPDVSASAMNTWWLMKAPPYAGSKWELIHSVPGTSGGNVETTAITVLPNGNIGFGVADPSQKFEIAGNQSVEGNLSLGTSTTATLSFRNPADPNYRWTMNGRPLSDGAFSISQWVPVDQAGDLQEHKYFTILPSGNVGFGTSSPASKLHVVGDGQLTGNLSVGGKLSLSGSSDPQLEISGNQINRGLLKIQMELGQPAGIDFQIMEQNETQKWTIETIAYGGTNLPRRLMFGRRALLGNNFLGQDVSITEFGDVGIGVINPVAKFEVGGDQKINGQVDVSGLANFNGGLEVNQISNFYDNVAVQGGFSAYTLSVRDESDFYGPMEVHSSCYFWQDVGFESDLRTMGDMFVGSNANVDGTLNVATNAIVTGNLGLGVSNPECKLDILGNQKINGQLALTSPSQSLIKLAPEGELNSSWQIKSLPIATNQPRQFSVSQFINEGSNGNGPSTLINWMTFSEKTVNGEKQNVAAFGDSAKPVNFAVNGKIKTKEVNVTTKAADWQDKVFETGYKLTPITEVEAFIKNNKHLPEIPSAQEVEQNGVNVGEMQSLLLKKIEEMTLYMIELKKENNDLKARLEKIEKK